MLNCFCILLAKNTQILINDVQASEETSSKQFASDGSKHTQTVQGYAFETK